MRSSSGLMETDTVCSSPWDESKWTGTALPGPLSPSRGSILTRGALALTGGECQWPNLGRPLALGQLECQSPDVSTPLRVPGCDPAQEMAGCPPWMSASCERWGHPTGGRSCEACPRTTSAR